MLCLRTAIACVCVVSSVVCSAAVGRISCLACTLPQPDRELRLEAGTSIPYARTPAVASNYTAARHSNRPLSFVGLVGVKSDPKTHRISWRRTLRMCVVARSDFPGTVSLAHTA